MSFPDDPLDVAVELQLDGEWVDVTADVYARDSIVLTSGKHDEGSRPDVGTCSFTMNNESGDYSRLNPRGKWYGKLRRNTPLRLTVPGGPPALALPGAVGAVASTPDASALDITADLDVRAEVTADWYHPTANQVLIGKWNASGQKSWALRVYQGALTLDVSADGSTGLSGGNATLPHLPPRAAVRATFHAGGGDGLILVRFYAAPSLDGPWTQFSVDDGLTVPGTFALFNSTAPLQIASGDATTSPARVPFAGLAHRFEVRNGIDGPVVAAPDFTTLTPGATSFTDSAGRAWTIGGTAAIRSDRDVLFRGKVPAWPSRWQTGQDVTVPVQASGTLRQLGQGAPALQSPMRREFSSPARRDIIAYWPMEDGQDATSFAAATPGLGPLTGRVGVTPAASSDYVASAPLPTLGTGTLTGRVPSYPSTGQFAMRMFLALPTDTPAATVPILALNATGSAVRWTLSRTTSNGLALSAVNGDGDSLLNNTPAGVLSGKRLSVGLDLVQSGNNINWRLYYLDVDAFTFADGGEVQQVSGTISGRTVGRITGVTLGGSNSGDTAVGHLAMATSTAAYDATGPAMVAWDGEGASDRIARLAREEDVPLAVTDYEWGTSTLLGPQRIATFVDLVQDAADADLGMISEDTTGDGLAYRARSTLYNQRPALTLNYAAGEVAPPLEPLDDDAAILNDVTVSRDGGSSARAVADQGPMTPDLIGTYAGSYTVNAFDDDQLPDMASWRVWQGTYDGARYPTIRVDLADDPQLIEQAKRVRVGDRIIVRNPPPWMPPDAIDQIVQGWTATLSPRGWTVDYNTTPATPYTVGTWDVDALDRYDTDGSQLAAPADADDTVIRVAVTDGLLWTTDLANDPQFDIRVGGEVMTVQAVGEITNANYDFRDGTAGWQAFGGATIAPSTARTKRAPQSILLTTTGAASPRVESSKSNVTPGQQYRASGWVYVGGSLGSTTLSISVNWYDANRTYLTTSNSSKTPTVGAWVWFDAVYTAPSNSATGGVLLTIANTPPAGVQVWGNFITIMPVTSYNASPQAMTVDRAVNGISKPQVASEDVRLAQPAIISL
ncbi:carbohydrate binding domain-containing protein [Streptomyces sp. NPDC026673]|uniref:carbohydrate binding domain-containing protein n=1 Tax=Streptomyces sp. NPDC026673 TaxID=3155724 RepID=UPI003403F1AF